MNFFSLRFAGVVFVGWAIGELFFTRVVNPPLQRQLHAMKGGL